MTGRATTWLATRLWVGFWDWAASWWEDPESSDPDAFRELRCERFRRSEEHMPHDYDLASARGETGPTEMVWCPGWAEHPGE